VKNDLMKTLIVGNQKGNLTNCLYIATIVIRFLGFLFLNPVIKGVIIMNMKKMVLSILVDNTSGVLSRVAGLFSRRGYNIDSLTVGETQDPAFSRMTVSVRGDDQILEQIEKQLGKLEDVIDIKRLEPGQSVCRELVLVKVEADQLQRQSIMSIANVFRANIVDVSKDSLMIELTGHQDKIDAFVKLLDGYVIRQLVRTGTTGLRRGNYDE